MATVSAPRAPRKARAPRPAAPAPVAPAVTIPEGWQPGGASLPAEPVRPARPPARHGKGSITLGIGGKSYRIAPAIAGPPIEGVVTLSKTDGTGAYAVATDGLEIRCTCPDHEINGATCKHIMMIVTAARILAPFAAAADGGAL